MLPRTALILMRGLVILVAIATLAGAIEFSFGAIELLARGDNVGWALVGLSTCAFPAIALWALFQRTRSPREFLTPFILAIAGPTLFLSATLIYVR